MRSSLRIFSMLTIALIVGVPARAQEKSLRLSVVDLQDNPIELVEFTLGGKSSTGITDSNGKARILLANETEPNVEVELRIVGAPKDKDYVFISPWDKRVRIPSFRDASQNAVKIVLAERGIRLLLEDPRALKALASTIIHKEKEATGLNAEQSPERHREAALAEVSHLFNLQPEEILRAIQAWGEKAKDPFEVAQADFIAKNYPKASAGFAQARELRRAAREKATGELYDACFSLGQSLYEERKYQESVEAYKEALDLRKDDPTTLNNLGMSLMEAVKYADANLYLQRALAIREKTLDAEHPDVAASLNNLAELYKNEGKYGEAEPLYKRALAIREKTLGAEHPDVASTLTTLAVVYREQGKYAEAEPLFRRAIAIYEKATELEHPEIGRNLWGLAKLYKAQGNYLEAEALFKRALAIFDKKLSPDDPRLVTWLPDYADLLRKTNREEEAAKIDALVKEIREKAKQKEQK